MNIKELQKPLEISDIDFRVGEIRGSSKAYATILAYKDARVDMNRLDEVTNGLWQNKYERDSKGVLQCGIGIKIGDEWVWKWSCGTPSTFEKEKGEYSDAFKRAGFMWGIGRELYDFPVLLAELTSEEARMEQGKWKATYKLKPTEWDWTWEGKKLVARQGGIVRTSGVMDEEVQTPASAPTTQHSAPQSGTHACKKCGKPFTPKAGTESYAKDCYDCYKKAKAEPVQEAPVARDEVNLEDIPF